MAHPACGPSAFPNDVHEDNYGSVLAEPQWVLFDFGANRDINQRLRIVCGAQDADSPKGCPRTFTLYGSSDSKRFSKLYSEDLYDYDDDYANGGKLFTFSGRRPLGVGWTPLWQLQHGANFRCSLDGFDSTCVSKYCTVTASAASSLAALGSTCTTTSRLGTACGGV